MGPVTVDAATVAAQSGTTGTGTAAIASPTPVTFAGSASVTVPSGGEIDSDPIAFPATTGGSGDLLVSLHVTAAPAQVPVHGTTTNATYLSGANDTANTDGTPFGPAVPGDYVLTGVDVASSASGGTIAVLGDQTSVGGASGRSCGGGSAYACTWVDDLAAAGGTQIARLMRSRSSPLVPSCTATAPAALRSAALPISRGASRPRKRKCRAARRLSRSDCSPAQGLRAKRIQAAAR